MKLFCKKGHKFHNKEHLIIGNVYEIKEISQLLYKFVAKTETGDNIGFSLDKRHFYIWDYFINPAEWREQQLNSILDE